MLGNRRTRASALTGTPEERILGRLPELPKTNTAMWKYYALLSAFFAALTAIFAKLGVRDVDSDLATAIRTFVILLIAVGIAAAGGHLSEIRSLSRGTWIFLILSAAATGLSWIFYFRALQLGDASRVVPVDKLSLVFTLVLAAVFLREPLSLKTLAGTGLILAGTLVLLVK